jgi:hypothetical protein
MMKNWLGILTGPMTVFWKWEENDIWVTGLTRLFTRVSRQEPGNWLSH